MMLESDDVPQALRTSFGCSVMRSIMNVKSTAPAAQSGYAELVLYLRVGPPLPNGFRHDLRKHCRDHFTIEVRRTPTSAILLCRITDGALNLSLVPLAVLRETNYGEVGRSGQKTHCARPGRCHRRPGRLPHSPNPGNRAANLVGSE